MKKTKVRYYVDIVDKETGQTVVTVYDSYNSDESYDVASHWNEDLLGSHCICNNQNLIAEVYEIEEDIEEEDKMKKYTLKDYKKFCEEALTCPPFEAFEGDTADEECWFDTHKIQIIANDCVIELDYDADAVNEIDYALREIYEAILGSGEATIGNTVGSKYRPATLKDLVKVAVREGWEHYGYKMHDFGSYIRCFIDEHENIEDIMHCYKYIKDINTYTEEYECDFSKFDMNSVRNVSSEVVKHIIGELICTERELLFDTTEDGQTMDIVFVMDFSLKNTGELIGWFYGQDNIDEEYINGLIADYKKKLFGEEN